MATIHSSYSGELRTEAKHLQSGATLVTDAPLDNKGKGEAFSPTDLLSASLGSCMLTIIGIAAREHGFSIDGTEIETTKIMAENPRRVQEIKIEFTFPSGAGYTDKQKALIERSARTCPVHQSLHPDLVKTLVFNY